MDKNTHLGNLIMQTLIERERSIAWLAKQVGYHKCHLPRMLKKNSFDYSLLCDISCILGINFVEILYQYVEEQIRCKNATR